MPFNYRKQILICTRRLPLTDPCCASSSTLPSCMRSSAAPPPRLADLRWPTLRYPSSVRSVSFQPPFLSGAGRSRDVIPSRRGTVRQYAKWRDAFWRQAAGTASVCPVGRHPALLGLSRQESGPRGSSDWD